MSSNIDTDRIKSFSSDFANGGNASGSDSGLGFKEMFLDVIDNVETTEATTKQDAYDLSIGNMEDLHTMIIDSAKADVALQTMVQLRNKFLDAYSEIMKTNL